MAAAGPGFTLAIGTLELPRGARFERIELRCPALVLEAGGAGCPAATLSVGISPLGPLEFVVRARRTAGRYSLAARGLRLAAGTLDFELDGGPLGQHLRLRLAGGDVPRLLAAAHAAGAAAGPIADLDVTGGRVDLSLDCVFDAQGPRDCSAGATFAEIDAAGVSSAEKATLRAEFTGQRHGGGTRWRAGLKLLAGTLYVEPGLSVGGLSPGVLLRASPAPIELELEAEQRGDGGLELHRLGLRHPGVATLDVAGALDLAPAFRAHSADVRLETPALGALYSTWLQPWVLGTALGDLEASGAMSLRLALVDARLARLDFDCRACDVADAAGRFAVEGLAGGFALHAGAEPRHSSLAWTAAAVYRLPLGGGRIDWSSRDGTLEAMDWQDVPILDGALHLDAIEITDPLGPAARLVLAGRLEPVTLATLATRFGWPPLAGRITGSLPRLSLSRGLVALDGDLTIGVFGGELRVSDLEIGDLLGRVPRLRANVTVRGFDLSQLTATLAFGSIEGHLDGEIRDLQLEAWQPVAFDAWFATPADDDLPHRISRQAVSNLGRLGAGTGGPLASGWLGLIPSYSYGALGLGCRLINGVCHLRGLEALPDGGFRMLTPGGWRPPWIDIRGAGEQVAWQTLVAGMRRIGEGEIEFDVGLDVDGGRGSAP